MSREKLRVTWVEGKYGMFLMCPYNPDFLDAMKHVVPEDERKWDNMKKAWWISDAWLDEVDGLVFEHFEVDPTGRMS